MSDCHLCDLLCAFEDTGRRKADGRLSDDIVQKSKHPVIQGETRMPVLP
uniref:Uncharacterized protein n=1 Tax=Faecalibaculum rodentium TaxID=1702221 RepID=A0A140DXU7_9FIRM|nr:hypothetical protein AALO17_23400 [Faecalibaculum rodentium]